MSQAVVSDQHQVTATTSRWPVVVIVLVVLSAFGPYVAAGIRTDQLAIYGLAPVVAVFGMWNAQTTKRQAAILAAWLFFTVFTLIATFTVRLSLSSGVLSDLDSVLLPLAIAVIVLSVTRDHNREQLLRAAAATTVLGMSVNVAITLAQIGAGVQIVARWLPAGDETVAVRAATLGRFTGILNQPALAGVLYGVALLLAVYLLQRRPWLMVTVFAWLTIGGLLGVSKSFVFVSLPIAAAVLLLLTARRSLFPVLVAVTFGWIAWLYRVEILARLMEMFPQWSGLDRFSELFASLDFAAATGNRFADQSTNSSTVAQVMDEAPLAGFGAGGLAGIPLDSAWVHALALAGVLGAIGVAGALLAMTIGHLTQYRDRPVVEWWTVAGIIAVVGVSAWAFPVFTGNRLAVIVWVVLLLAFGPRPSVPSGDRDLGASQRRPELGRLPA